MRCNSTAQVGDQEVGVEIQALLQRLGADHDQRSAGASFAELGFDRRVEHEPVFAREAAVMQRDDAVTIEEPGYVGCGRFERCKGGDGCRHGVSDHQHAGALFGGFERKGGDALRVIDGVLTLPGDPLLSRCAACGTNAPSIAYGRVG